MLVHKNEKKNECRPIRKQYFEIWTHLYALTWQEKDTFKFGSSLASQKCYNVHAIAEAKDAFRFTWSLEIPNTKLKHNGLK